MDQVIPQDHSQPLLPGSTLITPHKSQCPTSPSLPQLPCINFIFFFLLPSHILSQLPYLLFSNYWWTILSPIITKLLKSKRSIQLYHKQPEILHCIRAKLREQQLLLALHTSQELIHALVAAALSSLTKWWHSARVTGCMGDEAR